jgi:predicted small lipoprotein YifL
MDCMHDRRRGAPGLLAGILALSALLAGCGQRGPLTLPQPPEPPLQAAPAATPPAAASPERDGTGARRQ